MKGLKKVMLRIKEAEEEIKKLTDKFCGEWVRSGGRIRICGEKKWGKIAICSKCEKKYGDDLEELCAYLDGMEFVLKTLDIKVVSK